jgi:hypothetical protein
MSKIRLSAPAGYRAGFLPNPTLAMEYQGVSGIKPEIIRDGGIWGPCQISGSQAPLGTQDTSGISRIRIRDGGIRFSP